MEEFIGLGLAALFITTLVLIIKKTLQNIEKKRYQFLVEMSFFSYELRIILLIVSFLKNS